ncbi:MAG: phosphatidate cytidylyltransferase [Candidatus Bathyarchaeota archaeon]|nr:phosphatidate cytidylyltransferase [Candidatus Bathyarchaeota archaeon]
MVEDLLLNIILLVTCYAYILAVIFLSGKASKLFGFSGKTSRKFLHIMIGNLSFLIPLFTLNSFPLNFPFFVAAPFVLITFLASPYSPIHALNERLGGLTGITEEGHYLGLVYYAFSYTLLAVFFASRPYIIAAGILPMAYGDASAAIIGEKYGKTRYRIFTTKSLEGSAAMFTASFLSLEASMLFFSHIYFLPIQTLTLAATEVASAVTLAEAFSPIGFDNITVPMLGASLFLLFSGGV